MWMGTATFILLTCTCCSGWPRWVPHPWNPPAATGKHPKKHIKNHLFHHHLKDREGNVCKVLKGAGQWWWLHWHGPSPNPSRNPGDHCSVGSRGAAKLTVATAPTRNWTKQQGKNFSITQTSPSHLHGAQGIKPGSQRCADGTRLLPSCCYFLQAGTANPPSHLPVTPPWGELAHGFGSSKPDRQAPKSRSGEKTKGKKGAGSAGALWFLSRGAPQQDVDTAAQVRRALHSFFSPLPRSPDWAWGTAGISSLPGLCF